MAIEAIIRLARVPFARCSAAFLLSIPIALAACNTPGRKEMQVLNDRAQEQLVAGDVAEAEETVAKMLAIEYSRPNQRAEALLHGIRFYWNVADAERAITTCREAAALAGVEPVVRGTILVECGTLIKDVGDLREAEDLFLKLGDMEASHPAHRAMGYINLGELHLALGERHKALDDFRKGAALTHVHPHHRTSMQLQTAEILSAEGRLGEAAEVFEQLAEFPATSRDAKATALLRLAETWDELGDERRERATLRKVIQIEGVSRNHTITARRRLAAMLRQQEEFEEALKEYKAIVESKVLRPQVMADIHMDIGRTYHDAGRYTAARKHFRKVYASVESIRPESRAKALVNIARAYLSEKNTKEAVEHFEQVASLEAASPLTRRKAAEEVSRLAQE